ncbi:S8 family serine peptidase [bacterium SCSIO 12741]|nr:S8 family serine peptidase [bacterium SCSIO 12741]
MKFGLTLFTIVFSCSIWAQDIVQGNLWLSARAAEWSQSSRPMSLYVQGRGDEIQSYLLQHNGTYKHYFRGYHAVVLPENQVVDFLGQSFIDGYYTSSGYGQPLIDTSTVQTGARAIHQGVLPLPSAYSGKGVIMGIIDSGIDFNHPDFQDSIGNTRIISLWDQSRNLDTNRFPSYGYGEVYDSMDINAGNCPHVDPNSWGGHGTMVSGIAAGNGLSVPDTVADYRGYAYESPIIFVATDFGASNWDQTVADAVEYIYALADSLDMPCVINLSAGNYLGGHDGLDLPTLYIDSLVNAKSGRSFSCAAGNAGNVPLFMPMPV